MFIRHYQSEWQSRPDPIIGTAWAGKHVIILQCHTWKNQVLAMYKSHHAPVEPLVRECAESLSRLLSIGYQVASMTQVASNVTQYILIKN